MIKTKNSIIVILMLFCLFTSTKGQDKVNDLLLETIGALSAQGIYLTYTSIGSASDGFANNTYDRDFTVQLLSEYISLSQAAKDQLSEVLTSGILSDEDVSFVAQLLTGYKYLISEANAYINLILTEDYKYYTEYENNRVRAWDLISELLGFEE